MAYFYHKINLYMEFILIYPPLSMESQQDCHQGSQALHPWKRRGCGRLRIRWTRPGFSSGAPQPPGPNLLGALDHGAPSLVGNKTLFLFLKWVSFRPKLWELFYFRKHQLTFTSASGGLPAWPIWKGGSVGTTDSGAHLYTAVKERVVINQEGCFR